MFALMVGGYLLIGLFKAFGRMGGSNSAVKPIWMDTESNPLTYALYFTFYVLLWPLGAIKW